MRPLSLRAVQALRRLYGTEYQVGSGADLLYEASGASHDFAKGSLNIPYSFLIELRPQNTHHSTGFLLPEAEIMDTAEETWEAVKVVADEVLDKFGDATWKSTTATMATTTLTTQSNTTMSTTSAKIVPPNSNSTTTPTRTTIIGAKRTTTARRRPTSKNTKHFGRRTKATTAMTHTTEKHTFRPNTIGGSVETVLTTKMPTTIRNNVLTSKSYPVATTLSTTPSNSIRNAKIVKTSQKRVKTVESGSFEPEQERKTIVNVKICTGTKGIGRGVIPPFPSAPSPEEESGEGNGEDGGEEEEGEGEEEEEGGGTLMEILLPRTPRRLVKCRDLSAYCKWWRIHSLCADARVRKMCSLSCLIECQI